MTLAKLLHMYTLESIWEQEILCSGKRWYVSAEMSSERELSSVWGRGTPGRRSTKYKALR